MLCLDTEVVVLGDLDVDGGFESVGLVLNSVVANLEDIVALQSYY